VRAIVIDDWDGIDTSTGKDIVFRNVTIGGSKAGNVLAADPDANDWLACTRYGRGLNVFSSSDSGNPAHPEGSILLENVRVMNTYLDGCGIGGDRMDIAIGKGCIFAWVGETPLTITGANDVTVNIEGTADERILVRGSGQLDTDEEALEVVPDDGSPMSWPALRYVDIIDNGAEALETGRTNGPEVMEYLRVANNGIGNDDLDGTDTGVRYGYDYTPSADPGTTRIIRNVTLYNTLNAPTGLQRGLNFQFPMDGMTFDVSNAIIAGVDDIGIYMRPGGDSVLNLDSVALVTAGPDALAMQYDGTYDGPGTGNFTLNATGVISADPQFVTTTYDYENSSDFLRPGNPAYDTAGVGGQPLLGGVTMPAGVDDWMMLKH
jgi:hypothetical protein